MIVAIDMEVVFSVRMATVSLVYVSVMTRMYWLALWACKSLRISIAKTLSDS